MSEWPPLLLLHGFTGTPHSFDRVLERLPEARRVLAPALVGHDGRAPVGAPGDDSYWEECDRVASIARTVNEPFYVVGYSLGARIGLGVMARHAERVCGATLIGVHPGLSDLPARRARAESDARWVTLLRDQGIEAFVDAWQEQPLFQTQVTLDAALLAEQRRQRLAHDPMGIAYSLEATGLAKMPDLHMTLHSDVWGIQLVVGGLDTKFCAIADAYDGVRGLRVIRVAGAGHNVVLERPDVIAEVIRSGISTR